MITVDVTNCTMGKRIEVQRVALGWSRKELATKADLGYSYLSEIENGHNEPPLRTLTKIKDALGVSWGYLLD